MRHDSIHEKSYGIIPCRRQQDAWECLIILHRSGNFWGFPKGHAEGGESPREAAERELMEETGMEVAQWLKEEPFYESYSFEAKRGHVHKEVWFFVAEVSGTLRLQAEEILDARWLSFEKAIEVLTFPKDKDICRRLRDSE